MKVYHAISNGLLRAIVTIALGALASCSSSSGAEDHADAERFPEALRMRQLADRDDPTHWDLERMIGDVERSETRGPMSFGAYPVADYDRLGEGSFTGVACHFLPGIQGYHGRIDDKKILGASFSVNRNLWNGALIPEDEALHFFRLVVLSDFIDEEKYSHFGMTVSSRNHPDAVGQGFFKTQAQTIGYVALQTAEGAAYALVNLRLFDLEHGRTILIAPQKDGTLRSRQIRTPNPTGETLQPWMDELCRDPEIRSFFLSDGNI